MKLTTEEAIKFLGRYVGNEYYTPKCQEAHRMAIDALQEKLEREKPKMLTHKQLNELDECPIFVVPKGPYKDNPPHWCVKYGAMVLVPGYEWTWAVKDYGKTWIAYRHEPKEDQK